MRKLFAVVSLLVIASMMLAGCGAPATPQTIVQTVVVAGTPEVQVVQVTPTPAPVVAPEFKSKDPSTFVWATYGDPDTLDPALDYETAGGNILQNVYEGLIFYNKDKAADFVPQLATEMPTISADGKTYTWKIRTGVKFHEGQDMKPSDVAYSFQRAILQGGGSSPIWLLTEAFFGPSIDDVTQLIDDTGALVDDQAGLAKVDPAKLKDACTKVQAAVVADDAAGTVTMTLAQAWGPFLPSIAQPWGSVMSKDWVVSKGGWDGTCATWQNFYGMTADKDPFTAIANGTGPFKLDHWTKGQEIVLTRNDNYWRTTAAWDGGPTGPAKLQSVVVKNVSEWGTRFAMLQAGDADFATVNGDGYTQADTLLGEQCDWNNANGNFDACAAKGDGSGGLRLFKGAPTVTHTDVFLNFNISNPAGGNPYIGSGKLDGNGIPVDFFNDLNVRQGMNYCFDWDTFIKDALQGEAVQTLTIPVAGMPGYDLKAPHYSFDLDKCKAAFQASTLKSADGKSLWDTGFRFQAVYNTGNTTRQTVGEILSAGLAQVNPKFVVETLGVPWPSFLAAQRAKTLPLFISGWLEDIHDPHNWYQPYLIGTYGIRQSLPADLQAKYKDLLVKGVSETDPAKRAEIYSQVNQMVYDNAQDVLLATATARHYEQRWVNGYYYNPIYSGFYFYSLSKQ